MMAAGTEDCGGHHLGHGSGRDLTFLQCVGGYKRYVRSVIHPHVHTHTHICKIVCASVTVYVCACVCMSTCTCARVCAWHCHALIAAPDMALLVFCMHSISFPTLTLSLSSSCPATTPPRWSIWAPSARLPTILPRSATHPQTTPSTSPTTCWTSPSVLPLPPCTRWWTHLQKYGCRRMTWSQWLSLYPISLTHQTQSHNHILSHIQLQQQGQNHRMSPSPRHCHTATTGCLQPSTRPATGSSCEL
jgi:hypothetical protein